MNINKITGYHGTSWQNAQSILSSKTFRESATKQEWLGHGAYFFWYKGSADWWVRQRSSLRGLKTAILEATLECEDDQLLDLDDPEQLEEMTAAVEYLVKKAAENGTPYDFDFRNSPPDEKWCFACNLIKEYYPTTCVFMYTFPSRSYNFYSGFYTTNRQICVSNPSVITGIKEV